MKSGANWTEREERGAQEILDYVFRDKALLRTCFTHKSYSNVNGEPHNERLEFLGDAVLELYVTERLYRGVKEDEGALTERRKQYVSKEALERAEGRLGLMRYLRYCGSGNNVGGKTASNLFEAVVAGIYLDGGMEQAARFLARSLVESETENYKTLLQELVQEREKCTPDYAVREENEGFVCTVSALGKSAQGHGASKRAAETAAAKKLYAVLNEN